MTVPDPFAPPPPGRNEPAGAPFVRVARLTADRALDEARVEQRVAALKVKHARRDGFMALAGLMGLAWTIGYLAGRGVQV